MATPTSASARAGASLIPSPVMMTGARRCSRRTASSLPSGVSSASTSSTPVSAPTTPAASARSPVARTIRVMPPRRSALIVCRASGRIRSSSSSAPAGWPSTATNTVRAPSSQARLRTALTHGGLPRHRGPPGPAEPDRPARPFPRCPGRAVSVTSRAGPAGSRVRPPRGRPRAARTCPEAWSSERREGQDLVVRQAARGHDSGHGGLAGWSASRSCPAARCVHWARRSSTPPFFTTTPRRAAADRPETSATGAARISGHGVATTRTATARAAPPSAHATPATARRQRQEPHGVPVGEPDERRLRAFCLADQPDDARIGAVGRARRWPAGRTVRPRSPCRCAARHPADARPAAPRR